MKISELEWDDFNIKEIARHHVSPDEVIDVCYGLHIMKKDPDPKRKGRERYILSGRAGNGRYLDVVIEKLYGTYFRPVTAFEMSDNYKHCYQKMVENRGLKWKK